MIDSYDSPYPVEETFSRQQVQARTGVADDVLGFWIKQGLLLPIPAARRMHRRFGFEQLHIAALLNGMRSLGANIGTLRKFAEGLQHGFELRRASPFTDAKTRLATHFVERLHRYRSGQEVKVVPSDGSATRLARSEADLVEQWIAGFELDGADEALAAYALTLSPNDGRWLAGAINLIDPWHLTSTKHGAWVWIAWIDESGAAQFEEAEEVALLADDMPVAAFFLSVGKMIRALWPELRDRALHRSRAREHNRQIHFLEELEESNPARAAQHRERNGIPENWREIYKPIEELDMDG